MIQGDKSSPSLVLLCCVRLTNSSLFHPISFCPKNKFLVCVNIPSNIADSDYITYRIFGSTGPGANKRVNILVPVYTVKNKNTFYRK